MLNRLPAAAGGSADCCCCNAYYQPITIIKQWTHPIKHKFLLIAVFHTRSTTGIGNGVIIIRFRIINHPATLAVSILIWIVGWTAAALGISSLLAWWMLGIPDRQLSLQLPAHFLLGNVAHQAIPCRSPRESFCAARHGSPWRELCRWDTWLMWWALCRWDKCDELCADVSDCLSLPRRAWGACTWRCHVAWDCCLHLESSGPSAPCCQWWGRKVRRRAGWTAATDLHGLPEEQCMVLGKGHSQADWTLLHVLCFHTTSTAQCFLQINGSSSQVMLQAVNNGQTKLCSPEHAFIEDNIIICICSFCIARCRLHRFHFARTMTVWQADWHWHLTLKLW
jgi:hypothetical protein